MFCSNVIVSIFVGLYRFFLFWVPFFSLFNRLILLNGSIQKKYHFRYSNHEKWVSGEQIFFYRPKVNLLEWHYGGKGDQKTRFFCIDPWLISLYNHAHLLWKCIDQLHHGKCKGKIMHFRKILYKVYTFLIDFLTLCVILTIEQMKQERFWDRDICLTKER